MLHHVERRTRHARVVADRERARHPRPGGGEAGQDAVLAVHVVRRREDLAERRPAEHDRVTGGIVEAVGQVRLALADAGEAERRLELRQTLGQPQREGLGFDSGLRHRIVHPPSIVITCPVQYDDASEARKSSTPSSSSTRPGRPIGH